MGKARRAISSPTQSLEVVANGDTILHRKTNAPGVIFDIPFRKQWQEGDLYHVPILIDTQPPHVLRSVFIIIMYTKLC